MTKADQWIRRIQVTVYYNKDSYIDLSDFRIRFTTSSNDFQSPNNAAIRIYNLSKDTINQILASDEGNRIFLNAGYANGNYGTIFEGDIKQFRVGKESPTESYLDILAADGDFGYVQGKMNQTFDKSTSAGQIIQGAANSMGITNVKYGVLKTDTQHAINNIFSSRGKVAFGMARTTLTDVCNTLDLTWSIQKGEIQITENSGYLDDEIVVLNSNQGLIGLPEQTEEGIKFKCLLNSRLRIGGLVQIDEDLVNRTLPTQAVLQNKEPLTAYNRPFVVKNLAALGNKGVYRMFVIEHEGDTRGQEWYSNVICLAFDVTYDITEAPG